MKLLVSGEKLPADLTALYPQFEWAPCIPDNEMVDEQGWLQPKLLHEKLPTRISDPDRYIVYDQEGIMQRAVAGTLDPDDPQDADRIIWHGAQAVKFGKHDYPTRLFSHWCSVNNITYVDGHQTSANEMVKLSMATAPLRSMCDVIETSVYPYGEGYDHELWVKASVEAALMLAVSKPVMVTITNRAYDMHLYSADEMKEIISWIRSVYVLRSGRKVRASMLNLWHCDHYLETIASGENPEWWPGQAINLAASFAITNAHDAVEHSLQSVVGALNA